MAGTVDTVQATALAFANSNIANMATLTNNAINEITAPIDWLATWNAPNYVPGFAGSLPSRPTAIGIPSISASRPTAPTLGAVTVPTLGDAPVFLMAEPVVNIPAAPSSALPAAPGSAPEFVAPALPTTPIFTLPEVPAFQNVLVPDAPALDMPLFSSELPINDLVAPTDVFSYVEPQYESAMLDALKVKLMTDLINGGYGIDDTDEARLWLRAREREQLNAEATIQDAARQAAARGFSVPPGALNAIVQAAQQAAFEKNSSLSRDILIKKADLYVQNRQFTIQQVRDTEQMLITMFGYMAERLLKSSKELVELGIAVFNARVAKFNLSLETYKVSASVYGELIRGATLKLEAYKAQVEGAKLTADVQRIHAEVYKVQVDGVQALVGIYSTQVQAAKTVADIERIKLEAFRAQVDAYAATVGAKTAEFGMFESQIKGESAKIAVYQASAQVYGTQVTAYKTKADAAEVITRAQVLSNTGKIDAFKADISRYSAELQAAQAELSASVARYEGIIKEYSVATDAVMRRSQQDIDSGKANADIAVNYANVLSTNVVHSAQILASKASASANTMASMAGTYGAAASSAVAAASGLIAQIN